MATINKHYGPLEADNNVSGYQLPVDAISQALDTRVKAYNDNQDKYLAGKQNLMIKTRPLEDDKKLLNTVVDEYQSKVNDTVMNNYGGDWSKAAPEIKDLAYKYANDDRMWALTKAKEKDDAWLAFKEKHPETAYDFTNGEKTAIIVNPNDNTTKGPEYKYESLLDWNTEMRKYYKDIDLDVITRDLPAYIDTMASKSPELVWKKKQLELKPLVDRIKYLTDTGTNNAERDYLLEKIKTEYKMDLQQNADKIDEAKKKLFDTYLSNAAGQNQYRIYEDKLLKNGTLNPQATKEERDAAVRAEIQREFDAIGESYKINRFNETVTMEDQSVISKGDKPLATTAGDFGKTKKTTDGGGDETEATPVETAVSSNATLEATQDDVTNAGLLERQLKTPQEEGYNYFDFTPDNVKNPGSISSLSGVMLAACIAPGQIRNKQDVSSNAAKAVDAAKYEILPLGQTDVKSSTGVKLANPVVVNLSSKPVTKEGLSLDKLKSAVENLKAYIDDPNSDYSRLQWMKDDPLLKNIVGDLNDRNQVISLLNTVMIPKYAEAYKSQINWYNKNNQFYFDIEQKPEGKEWETYVKETLYMSKNLSSDLKKLNDRFNISTMVYSNNADGTKKIPHPLLQTLAAEGNQDAQKAIDNYNEYASDPNNSAFINAELQATTTIDNTKEILKTKKNQITAILNQSGLTTDYDSYLILENKVKSRPQTTEGLKKFDEADLKYFDAAYHNDNDSTAAYADLNVMNGNVSLKSQVVNYIPPQDRLAIYRAAIQAVESGDRNALAQTFKKVYYNNDVIKGRLAGIGGVTSEYPNWQGPDDNAFVVMANKYLDGFKGNKPEEVKAAMDARNQDYKAAYVGIPDADIKQYFQAYEALRKTTLNHDYEAKYKKITYTDEKSAGTINKEMQKLLNNAILNDLTNGYARKASGFNSAVTERFDSKIIDKEWTAYQKAMIGKGIDPSKLSKSDWLFGTDGTGGKIQTLGFSTEAVDGTVYGYYYTDENNIRHSLEMSVNGPADTVLPDNGVKVHSGIQLTNEAAFNLYGLNSLKTLMLKDISQQFINSDGLYASLKLGGQKYDLVKTNADNGNYLAVFIDGKLADTGGKKLVNVQDFYDYYAQNKNPDLETASYLKSRIGEYEEYRNAYVKSHPKLSGDQITILLKNDGKFKDFDYEKAKELHKEIASKAQISKDGLTDLYARQLGKDENGNDIYLGKNADGSENPKFKGSYVSRSYSRGLASGLPEGDPHIIPEGASLNSLTSNEDTPEMFLIRKDNIPYIRFNNQSQTMFKGTSTTKPNIVVAKHFGEALWNMFEKASSSPMMSGQNVILTSSLRSLQDQEDIKDTNGNSAGAINNSNHFLGEAVDASLKSNSGLVFGDWCQTAEGLAALKTNGIRVVIHGDPEHIHIEYNKENPGWKCEKSIMEKYASRNWKSEL